MSQLLLPCDPGANHAIPSLLAKCAEWLEEEEGGEFEEGGLPAGAVMMGGDEEDDALDELEQGLEDDLDDVPDLPAVDMV